MKDLKKNYVYNTIFTLTNILYPVITFPYVSHIIGPLGIGKVQFIISFAQYFALFAGLGIPLYGIREIARYKNDKEKLSKSFSELIIIYVITSVVVSLIYLIVIFSIPYFTADRHLYLIALSLILAGFSSIDWFYNGVEEFKTISLRSVVIKLVSIGATFYFIRSSADYKSYFYIFIFSVLGNNIINLILIKGKVAITFTALNFKRHLRPLLFIFSTTIATSMYTVLDTVLLGFLSNTKAVGLYTGAVKLTKILIPFITSVGAVTLPALSKNFYENNHTELNLILQKSFNFIVFFSIPLSMGCFLLSKNFIILFLGKEFTDAIVPMQILSALPVLIGLGYFYGFQLLVPAGKDKELFLSVLIGMVAGLILNFVLIPRLQAAGGAWANVLTEAVVTLCYIGFTQRGSSFAPDKVTLLQSILASLIFIPICLYAKALPFSILFNSIVAVIACGLCYALMQHLIFKNYMVAQVTNMFKQKLTNSK